jgi:hypothetical protein
MMWTYSPAIRREDRRQQPTLSVPALVFAGEHVLAQRLAQLSIARTVLAETVRLPEDLGGQLGRRHAVDRDTPPWRPRANAGKSTDLAGCARNRAEIVATQLAH